MKQYLPQTGIAQVLGGLYNQGMRALTYWSVVNTGILLVLGWQSGMGVVLRQLFPWLSFTLFVVGAGVLIGVVMVIDLVFVYPSIIAFQNRQGIKHDNPVFALMEVMGGKLDAMERDVKHIKDRMGEDINLI